VPLADKRAVPVENWQVKQQEQNDGKRRVAVLTDEAIKGNSHHHARHDTDRMFCRVCRVNWALGVVKDDSRNFQSSKQHGAVAFDWQGMTSY